jgi:DNA-binding CsgD family transcriptional regulator
VSLKPSTIDLETFNELVGNIYDAAMDTALWPAFMKRLTLAVNAQSGLLRVQDLESNDIGTYITLGLDPEFQQRYKEHYVYGDPLMSAIAKLSTGTVMQTSNLMPTSFRNTEFFNDYARPQGMDHTAGSILVKNQSRVAVIGLHRPEQAGCYQPHEIELLDLLIPHLQRAFQINGHLLQLKDNTNAAHDALHRLPAGIILVDASGRPLFINNRAETILAGDHGLTLSRNGLQASTWKDTQSLHKLIFEASQSSNKMGGVLSIADPVSPHPLSVLVAPVNQENNFDFGIDISQATAALFVNTAKEQHNFSLDVLCHLYGLTQAEARLAGALANGHSLEMIAEKFKLSKHTIRTQLKSCFQKTGAHRQTELVKLILCNFAALANNNE